MHNKAKWYEKLGGEVDDSSNNSPNTYGERSGTMAVEETYVMLSVLLKTIHLFLFSYSSLDLDIYVK